MNSYLHITRIILPIRNIIARYVKLLRYVRKGRVGFVRLFERVFNIGNGNDKNNYVPIHTLLYPKQDKDKFLSQRQLRHNASTFRFFFPRRYSQSQKQVSLYNQNLSLTRTFPRNE